MAGWMWGIKGAILRLNDETRPRSPVGDGTDVLQGVGSEDIIEIAIHIVLWNNLGMAASNDHFDACVDAFYTGC